MILNQSVDLVWRAAAAGLLRAEETMLGFLGGKCCRKNNSHSSVKRILEVHHPVVWSLDKNSIRAWSPVDSEAAQENEEKK